MLREEPEIIIRVRHHICQGKFLFLGKIHLQLHIIGRTLVGHQERHVLLEERLSPKHQVRKYGLIGRIVAEMLVTREDIVHECRPATPMSENEHRVHLQRLVRNLTVTRIFEGLQQAEQAANGFSQKIFITKSFVDRFIAVTALNVFQSAPTKVLIGSLSNSSNPIPYLFSVIHLTETPCRSSSLQTERIAS